MKNHFINIGFVVSHFAHVNLLH